MSGMRSERSSKTKLSSGWRSNFFDDGGSEFRSSRPRIHDWMRFDIKNLANYNQNNGFDNLNIDPVWMMPEGGKNMERSKNRHHLNETRGFKQEPFWVKNDGETTKKSSSRGHVVECWPLNDSDTTTNSKVSSKKSNLRSHVTRSSSKLSYDSTGPNDERYYVKPSPSQSSISSSSSRRPQRTKYLVPTKRGDGNEPLSLPANLGMRLTSRSSPSLAVTKEEEDEELEDGDIPHPDYSPEQSRKSYNNPQSNVDKPNINVNVWANSNRYKGSLENVLDDKKTSNVRKIAQHIQKLSEQDLKRRQDREVVSFNDNQEEGWGVNRLEPSVKISEYDQFRRPTKSKTRPGIPNQRIYRPPLLSQPLPKIPTEYEDFRKMSTRNLNIDANRQQDGHDRANDIVLNTKNFVRHKDYENRSKTEKIQKNLSAAFEVLRKPQQSFIKAMENHRNRNLSTSDGNSRMSSARSSIESRPMNEPEDTYSVILEDQPPPLPPLPPPIPFASMPVTTNFPGKSDNYFRRRHGSDYSDPWQRDISERSFVLESSSTIRQSPLPPPPPGFDEVQAKQSHFFNSLFPSRANRFGYPVYPERQFGIPSRGGPPVSFAGFSPELHSLGLNFSHFPEDLSLSIIAEASNKKNKRKNLVNILKEWIDS